MSPEGGRPLGGLRAKWGEEDGRPSCTPLRPPGLVRWGDDDGRERGKPEDGGAERPDVEGRDHDAFAVDLDPGRAVECEPGRVVGVDVPVFQMPVLPLEAGRLLESLSECDLYLELEPISECEECGVTACS